MYKFLFWKIALVFAIPFFSHQPLTGGEWGTGIPLNTPRTNACAVVLDGKIYILGGKTTGDITLNTVEVFDSASNRWDDSRAAAFTTARHSATAIVFNNFIYLIGGVDSEGRVIDDVESYNPASNAWHTIEKLLFKRKGHFAVILNNRVCVMGGKDENDEFLAAIEWYKEEEELWIEANSHLYAQRVWSFTALVGNDVYMFGGFNPFPVVSNVKGNTSADWFFSWTYLPPLHAGRGYGATAVLHNKIYLMGGETLSGTHKDTTDIVETYDWNTKQIEYAPSLPVPRLGMAAVALNDTIYLVGGRGTGENGILSLVETYTDTAIVAIGNENPAQIPLSHARIVGYPNPFNGVIHLEVAIPQRGDNELTIYNLQGQEVKSLYKGALQSGEHVFQWKGNNNANAPVSSGIYFAVIKAKTYSEKFKVVYLK